MIIKLIKHKTEAESYNVAGKMALSLICLFEKLLIMFDKNNQNKNMNVADDPYNSYDATHC